MPTVSVRHPFDRNGTDRIPVIVWDMENQPHIFNRYLTDEEVESSKIVDWETSGYVALQMPDGKVHIVYNIDLD